MDRRPVPTAVYIIGVVIFVSLIILTATQYERAKEAEAYAERTQVKLEAADAELAEIKALLTATEAHLATTEGRLETTSRSLDRVTSARSTQHRTCRYLVRVNDQLLAGSTAYGSATTYLLDDRLAPAQRSLGQAARHLRMVQTLVERSGSRTLSQLVQRCAPVRS
jgi:chemotaxis regulatin CheY-phosphate phosphatase CheZ